MSVQDLVEATYAAYKARDLEGTMAAFDESVRFEWPVDGASPLCGCCHGRKAMMERLTALAAGFDYLDFQVDDLIVSGDRAAARVSMTVKSKLTGETVVNQAAHFWRFEGGKAVELVEHYDTALVNSHYAAQGTKSA